MANSANLLALASHIEKTTLVGGVTHSIYTDKDRHYSDDPNLPMNGFNMFHSLPVNWNEGRCGCIMAHAIVFFDISLANIENEDRVGPSQLPGGGGVLNKVGDHLGITDFNSQNELFCPSGDFSWLDITPKIAANALREVAAGLSIRKAWRKAMRGNWFDRLVAWFRA